MIKAIEFPNQTFASKAALFAALRKHEGQLVAAKKAAIYKSYLKGQLGNFAIFKEMTAEKAAALGMKDGYIYPVINSAYWYDSHGDVHVTGNWNKTAKDQAGKVWYVDAHELGVGDVIARPDSVKMLIKNIPWQLLRKDLPGETECLVFEIAKADIVHATALQAIEEKWPVQNSVRMQYMEIRLALNSEVADDAKQKKVWDEHYPNIANKEEVDSYGYFWAVKETKIVAEGSMVLLGSNNATAILQSEAAENGTSNKSGPEVPPTTKQIKFSQLKLKK